MFPQRRMTTDTPDGNYSQALNLFVRGEGGWVQMPSRSISLNDYMKQLIKAHNADIDTEGTPEEFDMTLYEHLFDGPETIEGLLAEHYTLSWALASLRDKLKHYEDALIPEIMPEGLQTIDRAIGTYGKDAQLTKAVEEMSELTKALCKLKECKRKYDTPFNRETQEVYSNVEEETADVFIMLVQLFAIFNPHELVNITKIVWDKLDRLKDNLDKEAAQATIKAYCDAIRSMTGEAGSAAEAVANAAASHLKTTPTTTPTATTVAGHANGTLSAQEDVYIAGEKGPELIIGARGSEVFPTQETERILAAVNSAKNATNAPEPTASPLPENDLPEGMEAVKEYSYLTADGQGSDAQPTGIEYVEPEVQAQTTEEAAPAEEAPVNTTAPAASDAQQEAPASSSDAPSIGETVKRIILEIHGSGSIDVGGMNEESVLDILTRHAKPVLMSIIKGEIFEEGDLAYDF